MRYTQCRMTYTAHGAKLIRPDPNIQHGSGAEEPIKRTDKRASLPNKRSRPANQLQRWNIYMNYTAGERRVASENRGPDSSATRELPRTHFRIGSQLTGRWNSLYPVQSGTCRQTAHFLLTPTCQPSKKYSTHICRPHIIIITPLHRHLRYLSALYNREIAAKFPGNHGGERGK